MSAYRDLRIKWELTKKELLDKKCISLVNEQKKHCLIRFM